MSDRAYLVGREGETEAAAIYRQSIINQERGQRLKLRFPPGGAWQKLDSQALSSNPKTCDARQYYITVIPVRQKDILSNDSYSRVRNCPRRPSDTKILSRKLGE
jgi:hypothetical protein